MKILNAGLTEYNEALKNLNDKLVAIGKYIEVEEYIFDLWIEEMKKDMNIIIY